MDGRTACRSVLLAGLLIGVAWVPGVLAQQQQEAGREELVEEIVAWVNDDVVMLSDLREAEQQAIQQVMSQTSASGEAMAAQVQEVKQRVLLEQIWNRLLVQEAEQLFDLEMLKQDLLDSFMKRQQIDTVEQLEAALAQYGLTRERLEDRLLLQAAPNYVIENRVEVNLGVSEEEAREFYEENIDRFATDASVTFREIVLYARDERARTERRDEAERIAERARETDDFEALVAHVSEAPSKSIGGRIGPVDPKDLVGPITEAVMEGGPVGGVVGPVETSQGFHILKVEQRQESEVPAFEEVRAECERFCRQAKFEPAFKDFIAELWERSRVEVREPYMDRIPEPWSETVVVRQ
jgi:parvulin-like peptidyl-prolyl isomerase